MTETLQKTKSGEQTESTGSRGAMRLRVCFVCTGNTCRSPMAEAVANHFSDRLSDGTVEAFSAGIAANEGEPIAKNAVLALERAGIEEKEGHGYQTHRARNLTGTEAERFDLLVGMTDRHTMELMLRFPQFAGRITGMPEPIPDPYGGDEETYRACLQAITRGVRKLLFPEVPEA